MQNRAEFELEMELEREMLFKLIKQHFESSDPRRVLDRGGFGIIVDGGDRVYKVIINHIAEGYDPTSIENLTPHHVEIAKAEIGFYQMESLEGLIPRLLSDPVATDKYIILETEKVEESVVFKKLPLFLKKVLIKRVKKRLLEARVLPRFDTEIVYDKKTKRIRLLDLGSLEHHPEMSTAEFSALLDQGIESAVGRPILKIST